MLKKKPNKKPKKPAIRKEDRRWEAFRETYLQSLDHNCKFQIDKISFLNLINNNKKNIDGFTNLNIKIISNYDTYSMHYFSIKIIIYYLLFLTVVECNKIVSLLNIIAENSNGTTAYTGTNLGPIPSLEFWDSLS